MTDMLEGGILSPKATYKLTSFLVRRSGGCGDRGTFLNRSGCRPVAWAGAARTLSTGSLSGRRCPIACARPRIRARLSPRSSDTGDGVAIDDAAGTSTDREGHQRAARITRVPGTCGVIFGVAAVRAWLLPNCYPI